MSRFGWTVELVFVDIQLVISPSCCRHFFKRYNAKVILTDKYFKIPYLFVRMSMCEMDSAQTRPSGGTYMMEEFMARFMARQSARCGAR